jgi:alpha-D-ribose 1-methylphosphonate 5-triphosphate diphosphatase
MRTTIRGGTALLGDRLARADIHIGPAQSQSREQERSGQIAKIDGEMACDRVLDATGLLVLPALVDVHGDAFERQIEPRPGVVFDLELALLETDRQLVANGIATAFHGVTWSWEPGLRNAANAHAMLAAIERLRPRLAADTRIHLRHETFNLDAEATIAEWLAGRHIDCLAFNDHMTGTIKDRHRPEKMAGMIQRARVGAAEFGALVDRVYARRDEVPASLTRLAAAARAAGVPMLSHDDRDIVTRDWFRARGVTISEFPVTAEVAAAACAGGDATVFGAPNVVRGGSHTGCPSASEMVSRGHCTMLASDYYYPALLQAPFKLAADGVAQLPATWPLVSRNPSVALGLTDRGVIDVGMRADIVLVDAGRERLPHVVATIVDGRIRHLAEGTRLTCP